MVSNRRRAAPLDDRAGDRARAPLFAVEMENVGEFRLRGVVDEIGGAYALALHAHVERAVVAEGEAALGPVELHRGDADVENDAVHGLEARPPRTMSNECAEAAGNERKASLDFGRQGSAAAIASGSRSIAITRLAGFASRIACV